MIFHLPFVYEAIIKKEPKGKEECVVIEDSIKLEVQHFNHDDCQGAIYMDKKVLISEGHLLTPFNEIVSDGIEIAITSLDIQMNTSRQAMGIPNKQATALFPFLGYYDDKIPDMCNKVRLKALAEAELFGLSKSKDDTPHYEWICDSRKQTVAKLKEIADNLALVDDVIHTKSPEPAIIDVMF